MKIFLLPVYVKYILYSKSIMKGENVQEYQGEEKQVDVYHIKSEFLVNNVFRPHSVQGKKKKRYPDFPKLILVIK